MAANRIFRLPMLFFRSRFEMIQELAHEIGVDILDIHLHRLAAQLLLGEGQQQFQGVAVALCRVFASVKLAAQAIVEEVLQMWCQWMSAHDPALLSGAVPERSLARASNSGTASMYQYVPPGQEWPRTVLSLYISASTSNPCRNQSSSVFVA